ncbi:MAG: hypothetical protein GC206_03520 [Alphaproteobacteria bacterium]|nr:hypothetical protein [Alphaproteobacteria bacterium]
MNRRIACLAVAVAVALSACASSQHYGRLQPLTEAEAEALTCADVAAELHRVEGFLFEVNASAPVSLVPAAADRSVGNLRERDAARASAEVRRAQLLLAESRMNCDVLRGRVADSAF